MSSRDGSQPPGGRLSLGGRKGAARPHPKFRADTNYGRLTGKLMNYGDIEKDNEGFEDFEKYFNDGVFVSPPPVVTKPPAKVRSKTPSKNTRPIFEEDQQGFDEDEDSPERPLLNPSRASTSKAVEPLTRRLAEPSVVDYDRIPAPKASQPKQRPQTTTAAQSRPRPGSSIPLTSRLANSPKGKERAASTSYAGHGDANGFADDVNDTSNMSITPIIQSSQRSASGLRNGTSGRHSADDDSSPIERKSKQRPLSPPSPPRVQEDDDQEMPGDDDDEPMGGDSDSDPEPMADHDIPDVPLFRSSSPATEANRKDSGPMQDEGGGSEDEEVPEVGPVSGEDEVGPGGADDEEHQGQEEESEDVENHRVSKKARKEKEKEQKLKAKEAEKKKRQATSSKAKENRAIRTQVHRGDDDDDEDETGLRRSSRQRFAPLEWWRGERAIYRKPRRNDAPVPIIDAIVRIPVVDTGPLGGKKRKRGATKPPSSRGGTQKGKEGEVIDVYVNNPEEGWDDGTEENGAVLDFETKAEVQKRIAFTAGMVQPLQPANAEFAFQRIFSDGEFIAAGVLNIPVKGRKPPKAARDNTYLFYCVEGAVRVMVHRSSFIISTNGMFMVPRGNQYFIENICDRECKLFFAQARKVPEKLGLSPMKAASIRASLQPRLASQTPRAAAGQSSKGGGASARDSPMVSSPAKKPKPVPKVAGNLKKAR